MSTTFPLIGARRDGVLAAAQRGFVGIDWSSGKGSCSIGFGCSGPMGARWSFPPTSLTSLPARGKRSGTCRSLSSLPPLGSALTLRCRTLGESRRTDASDATNGERKSAAGRATETSAFSYLVPLAPAAEVAVSFIPVVGTGVALFAVYVALSDPNATTEDRAYALIGIVPFGKIAGLLAHSKVVLAAIKVAEKGGGKVAGAGATNAAKLSKQLGSEEGVAELLSGGGKAIAGAGTNVPLRDVERLVSQYGGKASDWAKVTSTAPGHLQTHAYRNVVTGEVIEFKSILP